MPLASLPTTVNNGDQLVATATVGTAPTQDTSEFSGLVTVAAAEAAIGLAILVCFFRTRGTIAVEDVNVMKG